MNATTAVIRHNGSISRVRMEGNATFTATEALAIWAEANGAEILDIEA